MVPSYKKLATYISYSKKLVELKEKISRLKDYIEIETGIYIPEAKVEKQGNVKKIIPIRYKNRIKEIMNK